MRTDYRNILILFLISLTLVLLIPIKYEGENFNNSSSFTNPFFSDEIMFPEDRTELVFFIAKNMYHTQSISLEKRFFQNSSFFDDLLEENPDIIKSNGKYYPMERKTFYLFFSPFAYFGFGLGNDLFAYKLMLLANAIYFSFVVVLFYLLLRHFDIDNKKSTIFSLVFGFGTGLLIYSRILLSQVLHIMLLLLFYVMYHKGRKNFSLATYTILLIDSITNFVFLVPIFLAYKDKKFIKKAIFFTTMFLILQQFFPIPTVGRWNYAFFTFYDSSQISGQYMEYSPSFLEIYERSLLNSFRDGGGLFLNIYGFFGSLFSERGIIFNSPFLIFSMFGFFMIGKQDTKKFFTCLFLINMLIVFMVSGWSGGTTPRYVRFFFPATISLSFFSFYWFLKEENKYLKIIFVLLVILSVVNVFGLSVRMDWINEGPWNVISYGYVLSPFFGT